MPEAAQDTITISRAEYEQLKHELAWLKAQIFGQKRERYLPALPGQLALEVGPEDAARAEETPKEEITYKRSKPGGKKGKPVRAPVPAHLPRREEVHLPDSLPEGAVKIGEDITEVLEYEPGSIYVRKIMRPRYALPHQAGVAIAPLPTLPIPRGNAGPGLLAHLAIGKYTDHLPFFRQRKQLQRQGLEVAESTIAGWFAGTCRLLGPLWKHLSGQVVQSGYLQADETPIKVLTSQKPGATHKGYYWVYHAPVQKLVVFDYQKGRSRAGPELMLENFSGTLQTDGYSAYSNFEHKPGITLLACMAHARRKFYEAQEHAPEAAGHALALIQQLYAIEGRARQQQATAAERHRMRQQEALPVLKEMGQWMHGQLGRHLPKAPMGEALQYTLKLWPRLQRYAEDGHWEIDNNLVENTIRPVALGRKNYLFAGSHQGAERAAMMYSFLGTCHLNKVEPFTWMRDVLARLPDHPVNQLHQLLPPLWKPL